MRSSPHCRRTPRVRTATHRQPAPLPEQGRSRRRGGRHPQPRQADRRLDIGSNLFSFRDPITGEITGFRRRHRRRDSARHLRRPGHVEYRILSAEERITALQKSQVDVVVQNDDDHLRAPQASEFSTVYLDANQRILAPRDSPIVKVADLSGKRVCVRAAPPRCAGSGRSRRRR